MTESALVEIKNLHKIFKKPFRKRQVHAVNDLNLQIHKGEVFGLLGPNGSGKTTTIKMMLGLLFPSSGGIQVLGAPPTDVAVKNRIGFLAEESYSYSFLTAVETMKFFGNIFKLNKAQIKERSDKLLALVGLSEAKHRKVREYSKGMARRLGLACSLINDPEFLILDEPTSGMDPIGTREVKDMILGLKKQGKTILLSSHLLADVEDVCDRIAILYKGILRTVGPVSDLLAIKDIVEIDVKNLNPATHAEIRALIEKLGGNIVKLGPARTTLEELFLHTVQTHSSPTDKRVL